MSLFERKSPPKDENKSLFCVDVEDMSSSSGVGREKNQKLSLIPTVSVTAGSQEEGIDICGPVAGDEGEFSAGVKGADKSSTLQIAGKTIKDCFIECSLDNAIYKHTF